ncbi:MAG: carbohydrate ABC transporter substrate-binding protein [Psychromonas sp.]|nr:carbohydrate ABC transporter substrate-binding protein [Alteromonadales bacterium]MCP5079894.1 carbohydrate ABC transporter substrate-binding protein [Psychromonas sp.]
MKKTLLCLALSAPMFANSNSIEVLHWWTSPGELQAKQVLEAHLNKKQIKFHDFAIVGEGGDSAIRVLQMRALSGNPPDAAQIKGPDITDWAKLGLITKIDKLKDNREWSRLIPAVVVDAVTVEDSIMAVPVNIHRVNWLWLNKKIFDQLKLPIPTTWHSFFVIADKIKAAGYLPLAHGGTAWQDALLFESMALSMLGAKLYKQAFVEHDATVLNSKQMVEVFKQFKRLKQYVEPNMLGKDWFQASSQIANDQAAMQFMGDWAKGMWTAQGKVAMQDYICVDVPESRGLFSYNIDSFVLFDKSTSDKSINLHKQFVETLFSVPFQVEFSLQKGSIPVRSDIKIDEFDLCSQKAYTDFHNGQLVPSFTQNLASSSHQQIIMSKIISKFFNDANAIPKQAVQQFSLAIRAMKKQ